jgi:spermidine synthase
MLAHVRMAVHPRVRNVLVIGGGDGGTVRELTKYRSIESIDLVEVDKDVVLLAKKYLPFTSCKLKDKRVKVWFEEGLRYVRGQKEEYDLIIVDSPDPYGPAEGLFTREFYGTCYKALRSDGILINQHESPFYAAHQKSVRDAHRHIAVEFPVSTVYQAHIPSYPSGHWLFGFASKKYNPIGNLDEARWNKLRITTRYYNTALHRGAFALPNYVLDILKEEETR